MYRSGQEALYPHVPDSEHAGIAEAVISFCLRKGSFNCLFSPVIQTSAVFRFHKPYDIIQRILPYMTCQPQLFRPSLCSSVNPPAGYFFKYINRSADLRSDNVYSHSSDQSLYQSDWSIRSVRCLQNGFTDSCSLIEIWQSLTYLHELLQPQLFRPALYNSVNASAGIL